MSKAIVSIGYKSYVMDAKDALAVAEVMANAERYESKYTSAGGTVYHIWKQDGDESTIPLQVLPDELYRMAKLAGKPKD